jgi:hypothetical protein
MSVHLTGMVAAGLFALLAHGIAPAGLFALQDASLENPENIVLDGVLKLEVRSEPISRRA